MLLDALLWMKTELGRGQGDMAMSWSDALESSLNFWSLVEGVHLLTLMLFFGTIALVDLRMLGVAFRDVPFSRVSARLLPLTMVGFAIVAITGAALFFAKPIDYFHNVFFRVKMALILLALANLLVFHAWTQRRQAAWDSAPRPPGAVRAAGAASLVLWVLVIACGRYIPANPNWFACGKPNPAWMNWVQACASSDAGAVTRGQDQTSATPAGSGG
jgi:hypothetical protein